MVGINVVTALDVKRNDVFAEVVHVDVLLEAVHQNVSESRPSENVNPHRSVVALRFGRLFFKLSDPIVLIGVHDAKAARFIPWHVDYGNGQSRIVCLMLIEHVLIVHLIDVIA